MGFCAFSAGSFELNLIFFGRTRVFIGFIGGYIMNSIDWKKLILEDLDVDKGTLSVWFGNISAISGRQNGVRTV